MSTEDVSEKEFVQLLNSFGEYEVFQQWCAENELGYLLEFHEVVDAVVVANNNYFTMKACSRLMDNKWRRGRPIYTFLSNVGSRMQKEIASLGS